MLKEFKGKTAVITGAGSGFGREFALLAARRGMNLLLADIQADALEQTQSMLGQSDGKVITQLTDVSQASELDELARTCHDTFGSAQLLFNNAGVATGGLVWEQTDADWQWVMGVNLFGVANGIRSFVPSMIASGEPAHVVNTASVAGLLSATTMAVYNASKHGVVTLSETLYHDLQTVKSKVGVSVLCPAFVPTGIADSQRNRPAAMQSDQTPTASMKAAADIVKKAVESGKVTASEVAQLTFDAIETDRFYIVSHPRIMASVQARCEDIAQLRNPTDPYASWPKNSSSQ